MIMEEEADIDAEEDEHLAILACIAQLQADEAACAEPKRGGSHLGRRKTKQRIRAEGHCMLYANYFADEPRFDAKDFRRRFRMRRELLKTLVQTVREYIDLRAVDSDIRK